MISRGRFAAEPGRARGGRLYEFNGLELHVVESGPARGRAIVMLHGFSASTAWFDRLVPLLPDYRAIRIDLLGHGGSAKPLRGYGPEDNAALMAPLLDQLDLDDVVALGHSMGCESAVALAEASPRVSALVLLSEGPDMTTARIPAAESLLHLRGLGPLLHANAPASAIRFGAKMAVAPGFPVAELGEDRDLVVRDYRCLTHPALTGCMKDRAAYVGRRPLDDRLRDLGLPTLVAFGELDRLHDVAASVRRYRTVPGVRVELLDGVGHTSILEAPERTAGLVTDFLDC